MSPSVKLVVRRSNDGKATSERALNLDSSFTPHKALANEKLLLKFEEAAVKEERQRMQGGREKDKRMKVEREKKTKE